MTDAAPDPAHDAPERPPPAPLAGRTVLVTGGAHRVGEAIGRELAARGARVIVHYHASAAAARRLAAELPHGALALPADLAAADGPSRLLAACADAGTLPDAVVHSAASFLRRPVLATEAEDWDAVFALNLRAFFLLARDFARRHGVGGMAAGERVPAAKGAPRENDTSGGEATREGAPVPAETADRPADRPDSEAAGEKLAAAEAATAGEPAAAAADRCLIAISDSGAYELWTGYAAHCVAKAALLPLVQVLAKALGPAVRVNAVIPGPVLPEEAASPERRRAMERRTLLGRLGDPVDVARAVAYLLENRFTTGTLLEVTGGAHLWRGRLDRL